jgi:type I restriction enzyme S subunit
MQRFERYSGYKDSGVDWIGEIPAGWDIKRMKYIGKISSGDAIVNSQLKDEGLYEVFGGNGLIGFTDRFNITGQKIIIGRVGALCGNVRYSETNRWISDNALILSLRKGVQYSFFKILLESANLNKLNTSNAQPLITGAKVMNFKIPLPPLSEQTVIANFLDEKTTKIDTAITQKEQMISLLKERKQILIQNAVTKGIDPAAKMKDSGVDWIGEIPEGWEVKRLKYILEERNERSEDGTEPLFMMSQVHGLVIRSEYHDKAEVASTAVGNKRVYKNDLVFNKLKAHLGVFFKSTIDEVGLVSPDYAVYLSKGIITDLKYFEYLFRHPAYISTFICKATGIVEGLIRLYTHDLFSIKIPIPSHKVQLEILSFIETESTKIDTSITLQQQQITKLKEYKSILIDHAVTGKIKVA